MAASMMENNPASPTKVWAVDIATPNHIGDSRAELSASWKSFPPRLSPALE
jgi:hypothetical protein